jgi:hypothetical protein
LASFLGLGGHIAKQTDSTAIMQLWKSQLLNPVQDLWAHGATSFFLKSFPDPLLYPQENKLRLVLGYALTFSHWLTPIPSFSHLGNQTWNFQIDILNQKTILQTDLLLFICSLSIFQWNSGSL